MSLSLFLGAKKGKRKKSEPFDTLAKLSSFYLFAFAREGSSLSNRGPSSLALHRSRSSTRASVCYQLKENNGGPRCCCLLRRPCVIVFFFFVVVFAFLDSIRAPPPRREALPSRPSSPGDAVTHLWRWFPGSEIANRSLYPFQIEQALFCCGIGDGGRRGERRLRQGRRIPSRGALGGTFFLSFLY